MNSCDSGQVEFIFGGGASICLPATSGAVEGAVVAVKNKINEALIEAQAGLPVKEKLLEAKEDGKKVLDEIFDVDLKKLVDDAEGILYQNIVPSAERPFYHQPWFLVTLGAVAGYYLARSL
jgi:hypothetical protein